MIGISMLLAQAIAGGMGFGQIAILVIIVLAVCGIVIIAANKFGVPIPPWIWQILGILVVAFVAVWAIKFLIMM